MPDLVENFEAVSTEVRGGRGWSLGGSEIAAFIDAGRSWLTG